MVCPPVPKQIPKPDGHRFRCETPPKENLGPRGFIMCRRGSFAKETRLATLVNPAKVSGGVIETVAAVVGTPQGSRT